jgi:hypothetical protein
MRIANRRGKGRYTLLLLLSVSVSALFFRTCVAQAIALAPTPYILQDIIREDTAFDRTRFIDSYKTIGNRNPKWDAEALEFLERSCQSLGYGAEWPGFWPPDAPTPKELVAMGSRLIREGCHDPNVEYLYAATLTDLHRDVEAVVQLRLALRHMEGKPYPPVSFLSAADRLSHFTYLLHPGEAKQLTDMIEANAIKMAAGKKTRVERRCLYNAMRAALTHDRPTQSRVEKAIEGMEDADPWLAAMFGGDYEISVAWDARGADVAAKVTEKGWQAFARHLTRARELLTRAWKLDPTLPQSAEEMITVVMGGGGEAGESVYNWFDRARTAQFDDSAAFTRLIWAVRPRWGGSIDQMAAVGLSGATTGRFDTQAPLWQLLSVYEIADGLRDKDGHTWAMPQFWNADEAVFQGYEQRAPAGARRDWFLSWQSAIAWHAGRLSDARRALDQLQGHLEPERWSKFTDNAALAASQVYAYTGPLADRARAATDDAQAGRLDQALDEFEKLAAEADPKDPSTFYFDDYAMRLRTRRDLNTGNWVDLLPNRGVHQWKAIHGAAHVDADGALVAEWDGSGVLLLSEADLGRRYEVDATMEYSAPTGEPGGCGLALDHNGQTYFNGLFFSTGYHSVSPYVNGRGVAYSRTIPKTNALHLETWDGRFTASLNGQFVKLAAPVGPFMQVPGDPRLAIYSLYPGTDSTIRLTAIRVRKLTERPRDLPENE